jgi:acyl homoserine lactone synthase
MVIDCVTIENSHLFYGNPLAEQHRLRYRSIIERQNWDLPVENGMEYDEFDNLATTYLVSRDERYIVRGVARLAKTDRPFMIKKSFSHTVGYKEMPSGDGILEGSRFCIDKTVDSATRKRIAQELVLSYIEYGVNKGISHIIGMMYPTYWKTLFINNGWFPEWLGDEFLTSEGRKCRTAALPISQTVLDNVREITGINSCIINYGNVEGYNSVIAA